jgi:hypothetical protein
MNVRRRSVSRQHILLEHKVSAGCVVASREVTLTRTQCRVGHATVSLVYRTPYSALKCLALKYQHRANTFVFGMQFADIILIRNLPKIAQDFARSSIGSTSARPTQRVALNQFQLARAASPRDTPGRYSLVC